MESTANSESRVSRSAPAGYRRKDFHGVLVPKHILPKKTCKDKQAVRLPRQKKTQSRGSFSDSQ